MFNSFSVNIIPENDNQRIAVLNRYQILDTPPEGSFDNIAKLATQIFNTPISLVSLVDAEEVYFKANVGMEGTQKVQRGLSLCSLAVLNPEVTVFEDATKEKCLLSNPLVAGSFGLKFYAGAPITTHDGFLIGTLCIVDKKIRSFSEKDKIILQGLAKIVMDEIELRLSSREMAQQKDDFLGIVTHEIKSPLTSLKTSLELLKEIKDTSNDPLLSKLVNIASKNTERTNALINDLLTMKSFGEGQLQLIKKRINIADSINNACDQISKPAGYEIQIIGDNNLVVNADAYRVEQVLINLFNNAIKYAPHSNKLNVEIEKSGNYVKLSVKDFGPGIPADHLNELFGKYWQANHNKAEFGLGLGLYICTEIIRKHGGEIGVESTVGEGSNFWFSLPL